MRLMILIPVIAAFTGCDAISPFVGDELKDSVCDRDGDGHARPGWCGGDDCDDGDAGVLAATGWYRDVDGDSFGAGDERLACEEPDGYVALAGDCDDTDEHVHPDALETCNGYDDDCDAGVDDENLPVWYADKDHDGWGHAPASVEACAQPDGYVADATDCDDTDAAAYPGAEEVCDDGLDQDCNGLVDDASDAQLWYADQDGDGHGDALDAIFSCQESFDGRVLNDADCDDANALISPSAAERCEDGIDNDCNGEVDTDAVDVPWYADSDGDGYGDAQSTTQDCSPPDGYVEDTTDCNDADALVNPGVEEVCNNLIDDNCDGLPNACAFSGALLTGDAQLTVTAPSGAGQFGRALALGDVTGDGQADLVIGAFGDTAGGTNAGAVYVYAGPLADTGELDGLAYATRITGLSGAQFGRSLLVADDLNGDGLPDLVVGSMGADTVTVWFSPLPAGDALAQDADATLTSAFVGNYQERGHSLSQGDVNGDGFLDLVVGAYENNRTYIWHAPIPAGVRAIETVDVVLSTSWSSAFRFGTSTACGDINDDGIDDLVVGDTEYGASSTGSLSVYMGPVTGTDAWTLNLPGDNNARLGVYAAMVDLDADGFDEILASSGQAFDVDLWWGPTLVHGGLGTATWGAQPGAGDDLNGDGVNDLLFAQSIAGGYACGDAACVTIVYGNVESSLTTAATWYTAPESTRVNVSMGAHDLTLDGVPDIVIGEPVLGLVRLIHGIGL